MMPQPDKFRNRVYAAADAALSAEGSVGPLEFLQHMRWLEPVHVQAWRQGKIEHLGACIQGSPTKLAKAFQLFKQWAAERKLETATASYARGAVHGPEPLCITANADPASEAFFRTHYVPRGLPASKSRRLTAKLNKLPDLVVFQTVAESVVCSECQVEMVKGTLLFMENKSPLCLSCADLDQLEFLPAGDAALTRRARKHSNLSAVVVRFSRTRNRYERQGLLVSAAAILQAEAECLADAPDRARKRARDAERRPLEDAEFIHSFSEAVRQQFPKCPSEAADRIAQHAAMRGSGRVGRSAAGRALEPTAVRLAVVAHLRHTQTDYDQLLMEGTPRAEARAQVRSAIDRCFVRWGGQNAPTSQVG
jgi:hypothetical protein